MPRLKGHFCYVVFALALRHWRAQGPHARDPAGTEKEHRVTQSRNV